MQEVSNILTWGVGNISKPAKKSKGGWGRGKGGGGRGKGGGGGKRGGRGRCVLC